MVMVPSFLSLVMTAAGFWSFSPTLPNGDCWMLAMIRSVRRLMGFGRIPSPCHVVSTGNVSLSPGFTKIGPSSFASASFPSASLPFFFPLATSSFTLKWDLPSRTASTVCSSNLDSTGWLLLFANVQVMLAGRAVCVTSPLGNFAVQVTVTGPVQALAVSLIFSTTVPKRVPLPMMVGEAVTPAGRPDTPTLTGMVKPSRRSTNTSRAVVPPTPVTVAPTVSRDFGMTTARKSGVG